MNAALTNSYMLLSVYACIDIDECAFVIERCQQHTCVNTEGSFYCECNEGYVLDSNGTHCNGRYLTIYNNAACHVSITS